MSAAVCEDDPRNKTAACRVLEGDNGVELARFLRENKVNAASISRQPEILRRLHGPVCGIPEKRTPLLPNKETAEFLYSSVLGSRRAVLAEKASSAAFRGAAACIFKGRIGYSRPHMGYRR